MRTKKFLKNSTTTALYQIVVMLAGLITPRIMLANYGSEINGLVSSIRQFLNYFHLVEAGLSSAAIYALYKPLANKDVKKTNAILSATNKLYNKSGYIFLILAFGLAIIYPLYIKTTALSLLGVGVLVLILGTYGAMDFFTLGKYRALLTADQKTYVISLSSILYVTANTLIIVFLGSKGIGIVLLQLIALSAILLRTLILTTYTKKNYPLVVYNEKPNYAALDRRWDALYLNILGMVQTGAPIVILTLVVKDLKVISVYAIFNMVIAGIGGVASIFISGLSASFGEVIAKDERKILQRSYDEFELGYYMIITVLYTATFMLIMPFVRLYTSGITDINYNVPHLGFLFVLDGLLNNLKTPQGMLVISSGHFRETRMQVTIQGVIVVVLGFLLAPRFGITGVLIASILSHAYRVVDLMFYIPKNVTGLSWKITGKRMITVIIITGLNTAPFLRFPPSIRTIPEWLMWAVIVVAVSTIVALLANFLLDKTSFRNVVRRVVGMVKK